ncbi:MULTISPECIES: FKBP-type peptidyl-prolyl cis-trans isomerase [unclassified Salinibacterium]|uniref:FKBP-type peptidyl-prolyl cis-trans isomerase n=1 Tax=unclassified Salinibacterium TaxID=2632331 RepID=UPI001422DEC2|nr:MULTISPECIES: FKBP-type peptidyl-prolyl cis-trans isomerase [unclassified Salinibacterium]
MPRFLPVLAVVALGVALTGCASDEPEAPSTSAPDGQAECAAPGKASDSVIVTGEFGETPTVEFSAPLAASTLERTVVKKGDGRAVEAGDQVFVDLALYDGQSGELVDVSDFDGVGLGLPLVEGYTAQEFIDIITCSTVGSRVVAVVPAAEGGDSDSTAVVVLDVLPLPTPAAWTENVPEVVFGEDGTPVVTIPQTEAPTQLQVAVLTEGDGPVVEDGDDVTVDYMGLRWDTNEVFDESFSREPTTFGTGDVVRGFGAALVGQKVGTTLLVSIPPALGYGVEETSNGLGGKTLVFLVEIADTKN